MRIAFDSQIFTIQGHGGISRYFAGLASHLAALGGIEARIFAPVHWNAHLGGLPRGIVSGVRVPNVPRAASAFRDVSSWLARGAIARFAPQIVHETYYSASPTGPAGTPSVVTVYDMIHERHPSHFPGSDRTSEIKRLATRRADHVICISRSTCDDLMRILDVPAERVSVVHLGFHRLPLLPAEPARQRPYLLYVGDRRGYKNFRGFVRAYAGSPWLRSNFDVVCFGGGAFSATERAHFAELGVPDRHLSQRDGNDLRLASLYRGAALLVYPSLLEGFGLPPLEAMSLDCPVACSRAGAIPEVVGDAGEYFDPVDEESIRSAAERVLHSPERRSELIVKGRSRCRQFSWDRCARETAEVYRRLCA